MNIKNKRDLESFILNNDERIEYTTNLWPLSYADDNIIYVPINIWLRYVSHINRIMISDPSLRFSVEIPELDALYIQNNNERGPGSLDISSNEVIMPDQFTVNCDVYLSDLGDISIPDNFIIKNKTIACGDTRLREIPLHLFGAEVISFSCGLHTTENLKNYYDSTLLPLKKSLNITIESKYRVTVKKR